VGASRPRFAELVAELAALQSCAGGSGFAQQSAQQQRLRQPYASGS